MPSERRLSERSRLNNAVKASEKLSRRTLYRSIDGCTICRVKSARHAFVDSGKWKKYFMDVFGISENRSNDICHLCLKSLNKWRRAGKNVKPDFRQIVDSKFVQAPVRRISVKKRRPSLVEMEVGTKEENKVALMEEDDLLSVDDDSEVDSDGVPDTYFDSPSPDEEGNESDDVAFVTSASSMSEPIKSCSDVACQTTFLYPSLTSPQANSGSFQLPYIDLSKWRQEEICCGVIFKGPSGEVLVDPKWLNPSCSECNRSSITPTKTTEDENAKEISMFDEKLVKLIQSSS